jgi:hypothetical protein
MSTPYSPQHRWMEWLVDVQVASRRCGSPICLHASQLGIATLITRYNETKHRLSPRCGLNNLEVEEEEEEEREGEEMEEGEESIVLEEMAGFVVGDDDRYNKYDE